MVENLNIEEFYSKYKDIEVIFDSYYKYTFTYKGMLPNGSTIYVESGGVSDDIYRYEVKVNHPVCIKCMYISGGYVVNTDGVRTEEFYDWRQ